MPNQDPELTVLLHESEQVTALIERSQTVANALFGAVLPAAGAFLLFAARGEEIQIPPQFLGVFFAAIVTLALIFNAGLWFEITRYLRYKYLILYPRIYAVAGLEDKENLGHFLAVEHLTPVQDNCPTSTFLGPDFGGLGSQRCSQVTEPGR